MARRALLATTVAASALLGAQAPALAAPYDWTGFYIGVHAGGATGDVEWTNVSDTSSFLSLDPGDNFTQSPDGVLGGGQIGFDFQFAQWLLGLEVAGSGLDFDEQSSPIVSTEIALSEVEWTLTAAARLGITWDDSLFYVKGGYAGGNVKTLYTDPTFGTTGFFETEEMHNGFVVGAGYEQMIGDNVSVALEYAYLDLGETDHTGTVIGGGGGTAVDNMDVQLHTVTARLNWRLFTP